MSDLEKDAKQQFVQRLIITLCIVAILLGISQFWGDAKQPRFSKPQTQTTAKAVPLTGATQFVSDAGIRYGKDASGRFDSRLAHVMAHTQPDESKAIHSVFTVKSQEAVVALLDEAWKKRGPPDQQGGKYGRDVYKVPMGRVIGTKGEKTILLVMERDSADIITAYPLRETKR